MIRKYILWLLLVLLPFTTYAQIIPEGLYVIRSACNSNYVIDLNASVVSRGNNIQLWEYNGTNAQKWRVTHENGAIVIRSSLNSQFVIDLNASNATNGENIQLWEYNGTNAQRWYPEYKDGNYILHSAVNQNYSLDLNGSNTVSGSNIHCWENNNTAAQRLHFQSISSSGSVETSSTVPVYDNTCPVCLGTKKCNTCGGRGYNYNPVGKGQYYQCNSCNGTGRCSFCN